MNLNGLALTAAQQQGVSVNCDGATRILRSTRTGQLLASDWKSELVLSGMAYNVTVGSVTPGGNVALITGGGAGATVIDSNEPELAVVTPSGFYHIPLGFVFGGQPDLDADTEVGNVILFADTTQAAAFGATLTPTVETPVNLLGGGQASVSTVQSACQVDTTADPVASLILAYKTIWASEADGSLETISGLNLDWNPPLPILLKGPCTVIACWGGTAAVPGMCSYFWAEVPISRFA